jgi:signal peptidase I
MEPQNTKPTVPQTPPVQPSFQPQQKPEPPKARGRFWREFLSTAGILLSAFAIAILLIAFVFQSYAVDGPSMQNTLHNNDRLIVWKVARTWSRITHHQYVPKRGDIVIFQESGLAEFGQANDRQLIKRVVGLPGDRVVVKNGVITIYNSQHPAGFQPDKTLPYSHETTIPETSGNIDITLNDNELFVCGDNRGDSLESRAFGPITTDQIVGKLVARILPIGNAQMF